MVYLVVILVSLVVMHFLGGYSFLGGYMDFLGSCTDFFAGYMDSLGGHMISSLLIGKL